VKSRDGKLRDGICDDRCRNTEIDQRRDDHVSGKTARCIEKENFSDPRPALQRRGLCGVLVRMIVRVMMTGMTVIMIVPIVIMRMRVIVMRTVVRH
jgi:hypothetical protein